MCIYTEDVAFIHIPKGAGISVKVWMGQALQGATFAARDAFEASKYAHIPLRDLEQWTGRPIDSFSLIFAVVRNPYEQQLSQWYHWRDSYARGGRDRCEYVAAMNAELTPWLLEAFADWPVWYEAEFTKRVEAIDIADAIRRRGYYRYYLEVDGEIPDNVEVVRFDEVNERVPEICSEWTYDPPPFPHDNQSRPRNTAAYYTPLGVRAVNEKFPWAFEHFFTPNSWADFEAVR